MTKSDSALELENLQRGVDFVEIGRKREKC